VLAIHLLLRPLGRLVDRAPATKEESVGSYTLLILVRRKHEPHLRAQLVQALSGPAFVLRSVANHSPEESLNGTSLVQLQVELLIEGNAPELLDTLVTRLSLEQGVSSLSWHSNNPETGTDDDRDDQQPVTRRRFTLRGN
jgi:putative Mg2+ transporter-C (MgtC) family protein